MKNHKLYITLALILLFNFQILSQVQEIKKNTSELFFELPHKSSKYDTRKILDDNKHICQIDATKHNGFDLYIITFKNNYKLNFLPFNINNSTFTIYYENEKLFSKGFGLSYENYESERGEKQFAEVYKLFEQISFRVERVDIEKFGLTNGKAYVFYSSSSKYSSDNFFMFLHYGKVTLNDKPLNVLSITVYDESI